MHGSAAADPVWHIIRYPSGTYSARHSTGGWAQVGVFDYSYDSRWP